LIALVFPNVNGLDYAVPDVYMPGNKRSLQQQENNGLDSGEAPERNYVPGKRSHREEPPQDQEAKRRNITSPKVSGKYPNDQTIDDFIQEAINRNNYKTTGVAQRHSQVIDPTTGQVRTGSCIVLNEHVFYQFVLSLKPSGYNIKLSSLIEKMDKSRPSNRVNPKDQIGAIPIKFLRIDRDMNTEYYPYISEFMSSLKEKYGQSVRIYTHRDWQLLPVKYFVYEVCFFS